ncbi:MAG: hypothetical protein M3270_01785 [Thermoproteota archaeon]|nr:hypothetical protein [Thermoproteota archaeon]
MKVANKLGFDEKIKRKALELMEQAQKKNIVAAKDPVSMATSILYLVISQKDTTRCSLRLQKQQEQQKSQ